MPEAMQPVVCFLCPPSCCICLLLLLRVISLSLLPPTTAFITVTILSVSHPSSASVASPRRLVWMCGTSTACPISVLSHTTVDLRLQLGWSLAVNSMKCVAHQPATDWLWRGPRSDASSGAPLQADEHKGVVGDGHPNQVVVSTQDVGCLLADQYSFQPAGLTVMWHVGVVLFASGLWGVASKGSKSSALSKPTYHGRDGGEAHTSSLKSPMMMLYGCIGWMKGSTSVLSHSGVFWPLREL